MESTPAIFITANLIGAGFIFLLHIGILSIHTGLIRNKNSISLSLNAITGFGLSLLLYFSLGAGFMFGRSIFGLIGLSRFFPSFFRVGGSPDEFLGLLHYLLLGTLITFIVSGPTAERLNLRGHLITTGIVSGLIYPLFGHWAWGGRLAGTPQGWLEILGYIDIGGSSVIFMTAGWVALALLFIIGPRKDRFPKVGHPQKIPASNHKLAILGLLFVMVGVLGLLGSEIGRAPERFIPGLINLYLGGAAGLLSVLALSGTTRKKPEFKLYINGFLAGLIAVAAGATLFSPFFALLIGAVGGTLMLFSSRILAGYKIDDAVDGIPVYLVAGLWGTLAVGLFGDLQLLGAGTTRFSLILAQLFGLLTNGFWAFGVSFLLLRGLKTIWPLRVSEASEEEGLNYIDHGISSDLSGLVRALESRARRQDTKLRLPVEPFTEVGQLSDQINATLEALDHKQEQLNLLLNHEPLALFLTDRMGKVTVAEGRILQEVPWIKVGEQLLARFERGGDAYRTVKSVFDGNSGEWSESHSGRAYRFRVQPMVGQDGAVVGLSGTVINRESAQQNGQNGHRPDLALPKPSPLPPTQAVMPQTSAAPTSDSSHNGNLATDKSENQSTQSEPAVTERLNGERHPEIEEEPESDQESKRVTVSKRERNSSLQPNRLSDLEPTRPMKVQPVGRAAPVQPPESFRTPIPDSKLNLETNHKDNKEERVAGTIREQLATEDASSEAITEQPTRPIPVSNTPPFEPKTVPLKAKAPLPEKSEQAESQLPEPPEKELTLTRMQIVRTLKREVETNIDQFIKNILTLLDKRYGFKEVSVAILEESREYLNLNYISVTSTSEEIDISDYYRRIPFRNQSSVIARVARARHPILIENTSDLPNFYQPQNRPPVRSICAVPIMFRNDILGVLDARHEETGYFNRDHQRRLQNAANFIALAINESHLYKPDLVNHNMVEQSLNFAIGKRVSRHVIDLFTDQHGTAATPLNIMKSYFEKVEANEAPDLDPEGEERLLTILRRNDELAEIANGISRLSESLDETNKPTLRTVQLRPILIKVGKATKPLADQKRVGYKLRASKNMPEAVKTDPTLLENFIQGIIEKRIEESNSGGIEIEVMRANQNAWVLRVLNHGISDAVPEDVDQLDIFPIGRSADGQFNQIDLRYPILAVLAEQIGGKIRFSDQENRIQVSFPLDPN